MDTRLYFLFNGGFNTFCVNVYSFFAGSKSVCELDGSPVTGFHGIFALRERTQFTTVS